MKAPIQFGKYYLLDRVAVGGMAEVYRAKTFGLEGSERIVALKRMLPMVSADKELVSMFIDEAKLAIQLNHPNICQVFDWGKVEDSYYLAMEYVVGCDLRAVFQRCKQLLDGGVSTMPFAQSCFLVMKLCEGLDYAHNKKDPLGHDLALVHRDVSPPNIMLSYEGEVKLIDFGIAKVQVERQTKTDTGVLKGKFAYMSPEQVRGDNLDRRSDIFSVGIVLYELLTGERLFPVDNDLSSLDKIRHVEILPPTSYNRRIPEELEQIVMKALRREPGERYQTAMELHADLQQFMYTSGEFYSRKELSAWMKRVFHTELEAEQAQLDVAREFRPTTLPVSGPSEPLMRARATMSMAAVRLPGEPTGALRVPKEPTGALRVPKEPTGGLRVPKEPKDFRDPKDPKELKDIKETEAAPPSSWTPSKGRKRSGNRASTPPPPPRHAVQSIAEAASSMAAETNPGQSRGALNAVALKGASSSTEVQALAGSREEDTAVDGPFGGPKTFDPRFPDSAVSLRPVESAESTQPVEESVSQGMRAPKGDAPMAPAVVSGKTSGSSRPPLEPRPKVLVPPLMPAAEAVPPVASGLDSGAAGMVLAKATPEPLALGTSATAPSNAQSPSARSPLHNVASGAASQDVKLAPVSVLPPPTLSLPPVLETGAHSPVMPQSPRRTGLFVVLALILLIGAGAYWMFGRSGELIVIAEPGRELIVLVDQRPVAVTDSPVRLRLSPGQHSLSVQHNGHTPWSDAVSVASGETVVRNIRLEPVLHKSGGFTLVSEPIGAMVSLDGSSLNQLTPLRVQSLAAGSHMLELRLGDRIWRQQINVEPDKMIDIKAVLPAADVPVVTPEPPTVTPIEPAHRPGVSTPTGPAEQPETTHPAGKPAVAEKPEKKDAVTERPAPAPVRAERTSTPANRGGARGTGRGRRRGAATDTPSGVSAAGNNGYLRINSRPWSKIIVDGIDTGLNTPQTAYRLAAGTHHVTLYNPQFNIKETFTVSIAPGETQTITKNFQLR